MMWASLHLVTSREPLQVWKTTFPRLKEYRKAESMPFPFGPSLAVGHDSTLDWKEDVGPWDSFPIFQQLPSSLEDQ